VEEAAVTICIGAEIVGKRYRNRERERERERQRE
jgi:hypothetical protein